MTAPSSSSYHPYGPVKAFHRPLPPSFTSSLSCLQSSNLHFISCLPFSCPKASTDCIPDGCFNSKCSPNFMCTGITQEDLKNAGSRQLPSDSELKCGPEVCFLTPQGNVNVANPKRKLRNTSLSIDSQSPAYYGLN